MLGERIRSHAAHLYFLALPDYFGYESAITMLPKFKKQVQSAIIMMKAGNELVRVVGGRDMHPVAAAVGGYRSVPKKQDLKLLIPDNFIFFMPKDIVSGDFYWFIEKNDNIFIAAVDCTGHGIPGAFMSIIGINLLENIVNDGITDPAIFLNIMNKEIINTLKKDMDKSYLKDGMDMTMCIIDKRRKQLKYAGAYNPAYIVRDESIIQLKGDRKSIGNNFDLDPFTPFSMKIREDDMIYVFTDGYTDQFGEKSRKKFKFKRFRLLLLSIHKLPMKIQHEKLKESFMDWKGKTEQIDDILVIGFKPFSFELNNK